MPWRWHLVNSLNGLLGLAIKLYQVGEVSIQLKKKSNKGTYSNGGYTCFPFSYEPKAQFVYAASILDGISAQKRFGNFAVCYVIPDKLDCHHREKSRSEERRVGKECRSRW